LMAVRSMVIGMSASRPPMQFGASGDATDPWCDRVAICPEAAAVERVRDAVAALPGAGWVGVERCAGTPDGLP